LEVFFMHDPSIGTGCLPIIVNPEVVEEWESQPKKNSILILAVKCIFCREIFLYSKRLHSLFFIYEARISHPGRQQNTIKPPKSIIEPVPFLSSWFLLLTLVCWKGTNPSTGPIVASSRERVLLLLLLFALYVLHYEVAFWFLKSNRPVRSGQPAKRTSIDCSLLQ
jgi:hypothetical protein